MDAETSRACAEAILDVEVPPDGDHDGITNYKAIITQIVTDFRDNPGLAIAAYSKKGLLTP